ncbi:MAG: hypothetical protein AB1540_18155, partial [Bdellovibrionota bacterium]
MSRRKKKLPNGPLHFAEPETQSWSQFQRLFAQDSVRWSLGIGVGLIMCVLGVIIYLRSQPVKGIKELQEGIRLLDDGSDSTKAVTQLQSAGRSLAGSTELYLLQLALFKLGTIEEKKQNFLQARQQYEASAEIDGPFRAESLLAVAR